MTENAPIMPTLHDSNKRIVLQHTQGPMAGVFSICGLRSAAVHPLPELLDATEMIDSPRMRTPGPVCLVAEKPRYTLYRQITTPEMQRGRTFNQDQR